VTTPDYADFTRALDALRPTIGGMSPTDAEAAILHIVTPWAGSEAAARSWFATAVIPSIGHTPEALVRAGRAGHLLEHIERIGDGGYA
jgi:hypothetical protein